MIRPWIWVAALVPVWCVTNDAAALAQPARDVEQTFAASLTEMPTQPLSVQGAVYVPAYSSVSIVQGKIRADFSVTLSVHNASQEKPLVSK